MTTQLPLDWYKSPDFEPLDMPTRPLVASWDSKSHPSQIRLARYLDTIEDLLGWPKFDGEGLALRLDVGIPVDRGLVGSGGDLDNYLYPLVSRLGPSRFNSVWASKRRGHSTLQVGPSMLGDLAGGEWKGSRVVTKSSGQSAAWKVEVYEGMPAEALSPGPVEVHVSYRLHPRRNWATLWKPTLDALGRILGEGPRPFHPQDDRITLLSFHRTLDAEIGWNVELEVRARSLQGTASGA